MESSLIRQIGEHQPDAGLYGWSEQSKLSCEDRETICTNAGLAFAPTDHSGPQSPFLRYSPLKAADENLPLSMVHVNSKPQYLVL
jgi:hypothetical protein